MKQMAGLVNCKKCGTLFVRSTRDICDNCYKAEMEQVDKIKSFVISNSAPKTSVEEIAAGCNIDKNELCELIEKGRLFSIMSKVMVKCKFCGIEIEGDQKSTFVCQKCLQKFNPKGDLARINALKEEQEELASKDKTQRRTFSDFIDDQEHKATRYGFIQNYTL